MHTQSQKSPLDQHLNGVGAMAASVPEVSVINVDYWAAHPLQLAVLLVGPASASVIPDPAGLSPNPSRMVAVTDPAYWASDPRTLEDALASLAAGQTPGGAQESAGRAAGAVGQSPDRLTLTVEEAAATLGISRAFAYEAVRRGEIPSIRIGRRVLVPRATLERMLTASDAVDPDHDGDS
jgi:excisionase family DNA binding protein